MLLILSFVGLALAAPIPETTTNVFRTKVPTTTKVSTPVPTTEVTTTIATTKAIPAFRIPFLGGLGGLRFGPNQEGNFEVGLNRGLSIGNTKIGDEVVISAGEKGGGVKTDAGLNVAGEKFGIGSDLNVGVNENKSVSLDGGTDVNLGNNVKSIFDNFFSQLTNVFKPKA